MKSISTNLRSVRRKTSLSQGDLQFLLKMENTNVISRCETGVSNPSPHIIFAYSIICQSSVEDISKSYLEDLSKSIHSRCELLLGELQGKESGRFLDERITYLQDLLRNLKV